MKISWLGHGKDCGKMHRLKLTAMTPTHGSDQLKGIMRRVRGIGEASIAGSIKESVVKIGLCECLRLILQFGEWPSSFWVKVISSSRNEFVAFIAFFPKAIFHRDL